MASSKLSIVFFYRRYVNRSAWSIVMIAITIAWALTFLIAILAANGQFNDEHFGVIGAMEMNLKNSTSIFVAMAVTESLENLLLAIIFVRGLWVSQVSRKLKTAGAVVVAIGVLVVICGTMRLIIYLEISGTISKAALPPAEADLLSQTAFTKDNLSLVGSSTPPAIARALIFWAILEMGLAIWVCHLPVFRKMFGDDYDVEKQTYSKTET
ncbi:MAG: hypothetical protein MMC23_005889 [Stictis urceolatum]|nr:hypothetical protein [Stictis urceolata]